MIVKQTRLFSKHKKRLHANQINDLDKAVRHIIQNPKIGSQKQGDLNFIRIHKFKMVSQEWLLAYQEMNNQIILHALGTHENFYRDLKRAIND